MLFRNNTGSDQEGKLSQSVQKHQIIGEKMREKCIAFIAKMCYTTFRRQERGR
jgi:hypothetical protein